MDQDDTETSARFFERFPHRQHRIRFTGQAEIQQNEIVDREPWAPPAGYRYFTAVRNVAPGVRLRLYACAPECCETDVDEITARALFESLATPKIWDLDAALREVMAEARK